MPGQIDKFIDDYGPYLDDLWRRVYRTAVFFLAIFFIGFFLSGHIINNFIRFFHLSGVTVIVTSPFQFLDLSVDIGLFCAMLLTAPFFIYHLYSFLRPAVSRKEFFALIFILPISFVLFVCGFAYGFFSLYWGLQALAKLNVSFGLQNMWDVGLFMSQLAITSVFLGLLFQFPIIMTMLIKAGVLDRQFLIGKRRAAYAIIVVGVSLLPPTDGISLIVMFLPLILMYELTIMFNWSKGDKRPLAVERGRVRDNGDISQ